MKQLRLPADDLLEKIITACQRKTCDHTVDTSPISFALAGFNQRDKPVWIILCDSCRDHFNENPHVQFNYYPMTDFDIGVDIKFLIDVGKDINKC